MTADPGFSALPDRSEDVAGVDDELPYLALNAAELPDEHIDRIAANLTRRARTAWKARALAAEKDFDAMQESAIFWRIAAYALGILWLLTIAALVRAVVR